MEITARTQPRELQDQIIDTGPEECESWESEELDNFVNFLALGYSIRLKIEAFDNNSTFQISYNETNNPSGLEVLSEIVNPTLGAAEDIELFGFSIPVPVPSLQSGSCFLLELSFYYENRHNLPIYVVYL